MPNANREWKTFAQRWRKQSRFEAFILVSVAIHVVLALLVIAPVQSAQEEKKQLVEKKELQETEKKKEVEKIIEEAKKEITAQLKKELAEAELKPLFDELTADFLDPETAQLYWDDLLELFAPDLDMLVQMMSQPEDIGSIEIAAKLAKIKEAVVPKLTDLGERKRLDPLKQDITRKAEELAKQLAQFYTEGLGQKVGQPVGAQFDKIAKTEALEAHVALNRTAKELAHLKSMTDKTAQDLAKAEAKFDDMHKRQQLADVAPKKDAELNTVLQREMLAERMQLLGMSKTLQEIQAKLKSAEKELASHFPGALNLLEDVQAKTALALGKEAVEAAKKALAGKPGEASENADAGMKLLDQAKNSLENLQAAVQLQLDGAKKNNGAESLLAKLAESNENGLAKEADKKFAEAVAGKALPLLVKDLHVALEKKLKSTPGASPAFKDALAKEVEKILRWELDRIKAGEEVAKGAAAKMAKPLPHADAKSDITPHMADLVVKAEAQAKKTLDKEIAGLVDQGVKRVQPQLSALCKPASLGDASALLKRIGMFQEQLKENRKDFLGQPNVANLAALRRKARNTQAGLTRLGGMHIDAKAYQQIVAQIKDRGQITGEDLARAGVKGGTAVAPEDVSLRPALVFVPTLPKPEGSLKEAKKRAVAPPSFKTNRFAGIPFLPDDAITIDGSLDDWKDLPKLEIDPVIRGLSTKPVKVRAAHQITYVAYCPRGILIAVDVVDTSGELENRHSFLGDFWLNDGVEIYLDTLNTKYDRRGEPNTHQFFAFPFGDLKDDSGGYESQSLSVNGRTEWRRVPYSREVMPRAGKKSERGWTMELLIPKAALRRGDVKPGRIIGFNLQIDTGTNLYYFWSSAEQVQVSLQPKTWGDIQFLGSDAKIELTMPDGVRTLESILPGQAIRVRVTDPDMNLDERTKDKISVTLRAASGDAETLVLEETGPSSGIFAGSIGSRLNIGARSPGVLEIFEGETVTVEYVDQARAYGERNVPIESHFLVGSLGSKLGR